MGLSGAFFSRAAESCEKAVVPIAASTRASVCSPGAQRAFPRAWAAEDRGYAAFHRHEGRRVLAAFQVLLSERNAHEMDMFIRQGKTVKLLTIGQPRVGDLAFVEHVQDLSAKLAGAGRFKVNRIMTGGDACAVFPPQALNCT